MGAGGTSYRQVNVCPISITQVQQKCFQLTFTIHPSVHLFNHGYLLRTNFCAEHLTELCYAAQGKITAAQILNLCITDVEMSLTQLVSKHMLDLSISDSRFIHLYPTDWVRS